MPGVPARLPDRGGLRVRAGRRGRRAPESGRAAARRVRRPGARLPLPRRHRARLARGLVARPVVGRAARGLPVGPRRARHEVPDRRRGRGGRAAGAGGLAAAARRAEDHERRRRGGRRPPGRPVPHAAAPRPRPLRLPAQRGRRAGHPLRRPPPVRRLLRREGHLPLRRADEGPRRPRLHPRDGRQRAAQAAAAGRAPGHGARGLRPDRRAARLHERARLRPRRSRRRRCARSARSTSGSRSWSSRRWA